MSIELLKNNIEKEKSIAKEISSLYDRMQDNIDPSEEKFIERTINSLINQIQIINNALPDLITNINFYRTLENSDKKADGIVKVQYKTENNKEVLAVKKKDHDSFLKSLTMYTFSSNKLQKEKNTEYIEFSNKFFKNYSMNLASKGYFNFLKSDLKKISSHYLLSSFVSMIFMTCFIGLIFSIFLGVILMIFGVNIFTSLLVILLIPLLIFGAFCLYPSSTRKTLEKNINQELPFLTIYMAAIATSGIEPSKIFGILAFSKDYPNSQKEIKKLMNYINFYGYDLVTALRVVSKNGPSERLAQLFDGLATTITSGGELTTFLSKHSDTLLFDYRLEREKYTRVAETFMDIYISIIIAAPMMLLMLFVLMSVTGFNSGFLSSGMLSGLTILIISALNIGFLLFLNMKQPKF